MLLYCVFFRILINEYWNWEWSYWLGWNCRLSSNPAPGGGWPGGGNPALGRFPSINLAPGGGFICSGPGGAEGSRCGGPRGARLGARGWAKKGIGSRGEGKRGDKARGRTSGSKDHLESCNFPEARSVIWGYLTFFLSNSS